MTFIGTTPLVVKAKPSFSPPSIPPPVPPKSYLRSNKILMSNEVIFCEN